MLWKPAWAPTIWAFGSCMPLPFFSSRVLYSWYIIDHNNFGRSVKTVLETKCILARSTSHSMRVRSLLIKLSSQSRVEERPAEKPNQQFIASVNYYNNDYCQMNESQKRTRQSRSKSTVITAHWLLLLFITYFIILFAVTWQTCSLEYVLPFFATWVFLELISKEPSLNSIPIPNLKGNNTNLS